MYIRQAAFAACRLTTQSDFMSLNRQGVWQHGHFEESQKQGKRIFEDLQKINFIRTSTSPEETKAAEIIRDELAKVGLEAVIEEFPVQTADIEKVSLTAAGKEWEIQGYRRSGSTPAEGLTAPFAYVQQGTDVDLYDKKGMIVLVNNGKMNEEVYEEWFATV